MKTKINLQERDKFVIKTTGIRYPKLEDVEKGDYDIFSFEGLDYKTAKKAVDKGWLDPKETQNSSPSVGEIMDFIKENPSFVAHGYVVTPARPDTRISFEGVIAVKKPSTKEYNAYIDTFRQADEFDNAWPFRAWYD